MIQSIMSSRVMEGERLVAIKPIAAEDSGRERNSSVDLEVVFSNSLQSSKSAATSSSSRGGAPCTTPVDLERGAGAGSPASPYLGSTANLRSVGGGASSSLALLDLENSESLSRRAAHTRFHVISSEGAEASAGGSSRQRGRHGVLSGGNDLSLESEDGSSLRAPVSDSVHAIDKMIYRRIS
jgi:hypothetical protein